MPATREITLRDANQGFARLIREVEAGEEVVITRHGRPVARLVPVRGGRTPTPEQEAAWERIRERMLHHPLDLGGYKFRREDAYDDV